MNKLVKFKPPEVAVMNFPDNARFKGGFGVRSSSSNKIYKISFDAAKRAMWWTCSCPGNLRWGQCRHLDACGLKGRKHGHQIGEAKKYGWLK